MLAFVGDVIFAGGIGRTDFPDGDFDGLIAGIRRSSSRFPTTRACCPATARPPPWEPRNATTRSSNKRGRNSRAETQREKCEPPALAGGLVGASPALRPGLSAEQRGVRPACRSQFEKLDNLSDRGRAGRAELMDHDRGGGIGQLDRFGQARPRRPGRPPDWRSPSRPRRRCRSRRGPAATWRGPASPSGLARRAARLRPR